MAIPTPKNNLYLDLLLVVREYQGFTMQRRNGMYVLKGEIQPSLHSPVYKIKVEIREGVPPRIVVLSPAIHKKSKHVYKADGSLCVYQPRAIHPSTPFFYRDYIIPWIGLWLLFYEQWLVTKIWYGPEYIHTNHTDRFVQ